MQVVRRADVDDVDVGSPTSSSAVSYALSAPRRSRRARERSGVEAATPDHRAAGGAHRVGVDGADEPGSGDGSSQAASAREPIPDLCRLSSRSLHDRIATKVVDCRARSLLYFGLHGATPRPHPGSAAARGRPAADPQRRGGHARGARAARPASPARRSPSASTRCSRAGLIYEAGDSESTGGRPPDAPGLQPPRGRSCSPPTSARRTRASPVSDLAGAAAGARSPSTWTSPTARSGSSALVHERFRELLRESERRRATCAASASASPARSRSRPASRSPRRSCRAGTASRSPSWFAEHYAPACPVLVDNDVNIMALGEHWAHWRDVEHLLFVKVGTGIGCGIVAERRDPPRRRGRRRRHRPHRRHRPRRRHLPLRQHRLPRGGRRRPRARASSSRPRATTPSAQPRRRPPRARRQRRGDPHGPRGRPRARRGAGRVRELLQPAA